MNLRKKEYTYHCIECGRLTKTLHEIFYGTADRKRSIELALQVPLCDECHTRIHCHATKGEGKAFQKKWIEWLGQDYEAVKHQMQLSKLNHNFVVGIRKKNIDKIKNLVYIL